MCVSVVYLGTDERRTLRETQNAGEGGSSNSPNCFVIEKLRQCGPNATYSN